MQPAKRFKSMLCAALQPTLTETLVLGLLSPFLSVNERHKLYRLCRASRSWLQSAHEEKAALIRCLNLCYGAWTAPDPDRLLLGREPITWLELEFQLYHELRQDMETLPTELSSLEVTRIVDHQVESYLIKLKYVAPDWFRNFLDLRFYRYQDGASVTPEVLRQIVTGVVVTGQVSGDVKSSEATNDSVRVEGGADAVSVEDTPDTADTPETSIEEGTRQIPIETPIEGGTRQIPIETPIEEGTRQIPIETPIEEGTRQIPIETPIEEGTRQIPTETSVEEGTRQIPTEEATEPPSEATVQEPSNPETEEVRILTNAGDAVEAADEDGSVDSGSEDEDSDHESEEENSNDESETSRSRPSVLRGLRVVTARPKDMFRGVLYTHLERIGWNFLRSAVERFARPHDPKRALIAIHTRLALTDPWKLNRVIDVKDTLMSPTAFLQECATYSVFVDDVDATDFSNSSAPEVAAYFRFIFNTRILELKASEFWQIGEPISTSDSLDVHILSIGYLIQQSDGLFYDLAFNMMLRHAKEIVDDLSQHLASRQLYTDALSADHVKDFDECAGGQHRFDPPENAEGPAEEAGVEGRYLWLAKRQDGRCSHLLFNQHGVMAIR